MVDPVDAVLGVAIWGSPQKPKHSTLTLLRSGLWAAPVRLGIPAWRRRQALAPYSPRSNRLAVLVPQRHRCRSFGAAHRFGKLPHQPDASAYR